MKKISTKRNLNVLIGSLKDKLVIMMLENSGRKRKRIFQSIMRQAVESTIPVRPGRQYPRKDSVSRCKFKTNHKRSF